MVTTMQRMASNVVAPIERIPEVVVWGDGERGAS